MSGWPMVALGDLFDIARGGSPRPISDYLTDDPNGVNWVSISDATESEKYIRSTKRRIKPSGVARSRLVKPGDFLLTNSMSFGRPYIMDTSGCIHDGWLCLSPRAALIDTDYLYRVLGSPDTYRKFERLAAGATVKNLNIELVRTVQIPLPRLDEQRRIAAILDQADELRRVSRLVNAKLSTLILSWFDELFARHVGGPMVGALPSPPALQNGWMFARLGDVARLATGHTPSRRVPTYWNGDVPWLTLGDVRVLDGTVAIDTAEHITTLGLENSSAVLLPEGTVCLSRTASVGFVTIMGRKMATSQDFVNWICGPSISNSFLMWALIHARKHLLNLASGSTHRTIYFPTVEEFRVVLPPIELQKRFAHLISQIAKVKSVSELQEVKMGEFFASLQHRAFNGELTAKAAERELADVS